MAKFGKRFYTTRRENILENTGWDGAVDRSATEVFLEKGSYSFSLRPVTMQLNNVETVVSQGIVRTPTPDDNKEREFGFVSDSYTIIQPLELCQAFDECVAQPIATMGSRNKGEGLFISWQLSSFTVGKDDKSNIYGLIYGGWNGGTGLSLSIITRRLWCENMIRMTFRNLGNKVSLGEDAGRVFVGRHYEGMLNKMKIWMSHVQEKSEQRAKNIEMQMNILNEKKVDSEYVKQFISFMYPQKTYDAMNYPSALAGEHELKLIAENSDSKKEADLVNELFNGAGTKINATRYGLLNAITEKNSWTGNNSDKLGLNVMFGAKNVENNKALTYLMSN